VGGISPRGKRALRGKKDYHGEAILKELGNMGEKKMEGILGGGCTQGPKGGIWIGKKVSRWGVQACRSGRGH